MANTDQSYPILRYDSVNNHVQYFSGADWYDIIAASPVNTGVVGQMAYYGTTTTLTGASAVTTDGSKMHVGTLADLTAPCTLTVNKTLGLYDPADSTTGGPGLHMQTVNGKKAVLTLLESTAPAINGALYLQAEGSALVLQGDSYVRLWPNCNGNTAHSGVVVSQSDTSQTANDASAILQVNSTVQGILPPRMTNTQRDAIATPAEGLMIYSTSDQALEFFNGTAWKVVATV